MENNQILITISDDKKTITVSTVYKDMTFSSCPNSVLENLPNAMQSYVEHTGLNTIKQFSNEECYYKGGEIGSCNDCN
jgi:hypothetical protein